MSHLMNLMSIFQLGLDQKINDIFTPITAWVASIVFYSIKLFDNQVPIVLIILLSGALFLTLYFKFINIRLFTTAINVVRGKYDELEKTKQTPPEFDNSTSVNTLDGDLVDTIKVEGNQGEVSHFQALTAALSATVGLGNIAGVAVAISIGGPGATLWMILVGLLGMSSKFAECTLGVKYREVDETGTVYGGPMHYLTKGLARKGFTNLGKVLAVVFAILCIGGSFGGGNMFQANQAATQFNQLFNIQGESAGFTFGFIMMLLVGVVIIGGIKRIGRLTELIVPFMCGIYVLAAVVILTMHFDQIPAAFGLIIDGAFSPMGITGGVVGVMIQGFKRAAFSNEAGVGSAAIAHSAVKTNYAASEGIVALLEPFIDTVVVCTMTALVIIITNINGGFLDYGQSTPDGVALTSQAFNFAIPGFSIVLTAAVVMFAFSTMLSWSYYGLQSWVFLFGKSSVSKYTYKALFCVFIIIGASVELGPVIDFSDCMILAMVVPNMIGVLFLLKDIKWELKSYLDLIKSK